jgi:hypothetical protein
MKMLQPPKQAEGTNGMMTCFGDCPSAWQPAQRWKNFTDGAGEHDIR